MKRIVFFIVALAIGFSLGILTQLPKRTETEITVCNNKYSFVSKQFGCLQKDTISKKEYSSLVTKLNAFLDANANSSENVTVSIYFRDLHQGPTFGINRDDRFIPASLLKLPLLMGLYNLAENNPDLLHKRIQYQPVKTAVRQVLVEVPPLESGDYYSVEELVDRMIIYSDNESFNLLQVWISSELPGNDIFVSTLTELGLSYPRNSVDSTFTAKSYASLFRQLYNSSYLSAAYSEKVLEILSRSVFKNGLAKDLPQNIKIAHKFGIRDGIANGVVELHDCGIIYFPNNPYVLCVMTRGDNIEELEKIISTVSLMTYKEVDSRRFQ